MRVVEELGRFQTIRCCKSTNLFVIGATFDETTHRSPYEGVELSVLDLIVVHQVSIACKAISAYCTLCAPHRFSMLRDKLSPFSNAFTMRLTLMRIERIVFLCGMYIEI